MVLVALAGYREHTPCLRLNARLREDARFVSRHGRRRLVHLAFVIHDAFGGVFGEDDEIHAGKSGFDADDHIRDMPCVLEHFLFCVQARDFIADDRDADGVGA